MLQKVCLTIFGLSLFGVILCSGSINTPLYVCFAVAVISFGIAYADAHKDFIKDRIAYCIAQIIIACRKHKKG